MSLFNGVTIIGPDPPEEVCPRRFLVTMSVPERSVGILLWESVKTAAVGDASVAARRDASAQALQCLQWLFSKSRVNESPPCDFTFYTTDFPPGQRRHCTRPSAEGVPSVLVESVLNDDLRGTIEDTAAALASVWPAWASYLGKTPLPDMRSAD